MIRDRILGLKRWKNSLLFLGLTGCAAMLGYSEVRSANARAAAGANTGHIAELVTHIPHSLTGTNASLAICLRATSESSSLFQPQGQRQKTALACSDLALRALERMPSHGAAYLVAAQSAQSRKNLIYFLEQSQRFAASEGWLAERRIVLAHNDDLLDSRFAEKDLQLVLTTQGGAEFLAKLYLAKPEIRTAVSRAVMATAEPVRRRFVNQVTQQKAAR